VLTDGEWTGSFKRGWEVLDSVLRTSSWKTVDIVVAYQISCGDSPGDGDQDLVSEFGHMVLAIRGIDGMLLSSPRSPPQHVDIFRLGWTTE
jgi:hypothetical protein